MDLPQKQRVPAADFQDELLKALALLDIRSQHAVSGDQPVYKRIVWASIPLVTLLAGMLNM